MDLIFKSLIKLQFIYFPLVWIFFSRTSNNVIHKMHKWTLRIALDNIVLAEFVRNTLKELVLYTFIYFYVASFYILFYILYLNLLHGSKRLNLVLSSCNVNLEETPICFETSSSFSLLMLTFLWKHILPLKSHMTSSKKKINLFQVDTSLFLVAPIYCNMGIKIFLKPLR